MIIKTYKTKTGKIICHTGRDSRGFYAQTGKPSANGITWRYSTEAEADQTAQEYFNNYFNF